MTGTPTSNRPAAKPVLLPPTEPVGWPAWRLRDEAVRGALSVEEIVTAHQERLADIDPWLNATTAVAAESAIVEARALDGQLRAKSQPGPLFGVPITVKDVIAVAGYPVTLGSARFVGNAAVRDAASVAILRRAGAVVIAKTNCPEFAFGVTTDNAAFGATRSPWGSHSPGGSSGGEAALLSAGASAVGLGTDYGGSVRWPAQCCGVLGLRPAVDSLEGAGQLPGPGGNMDGLFGPPGADRSVQSRLQVPGPLARTARDLAIVWSLLARPIGIPSSPAPAFGALQLPGPVGWVWTLDSQEPDPQVTAALFSVVKLLASLGVPTVEMPGALDGLHDLFNRLRSTDALVDLKAAIGDGGEMIEEHSHRLLSAAPSSGADPAPLWAELGLRRQQMGALLERTPLLICPVAPVDACDMDGTAVVGGETVSGFDLMTYCRAVSALGFPALSVPCGLDHAGLPVSVQIVCAPGRESLLFSLAVALEEHGGGYQSPPWL